MGNVTSQSLDQRRQALEDIRKRATLDRTYLVMNVLATIIACYGLLENSPAVVIGAMVMALLMGPLVGMALGVVEGDNGLLRKGVLAECVGILAVYASALLIGFLNRNIPITSEIMARTAPNFMDLVIALAGGAAGAYALVSPRIGLSVVGVAVAIALVPPLSSSAMLLARGEFGLAGGALLLAFTNIVAIEFAASVVLIIMLYNAHSLRRLSLPRLLPRLLSHYSVSVAVLLVLGIVLGTNLHHLVVNENFERQCLTAVRNEMKTIPDVYVEQVTYVSAPDRMTVEAHVYSSHKFTAQEIAAMEAALPPSPTGKPIDFRLRVVSIETVTDQGAAD